MARPRLLVFDFDGTALGGHSPYAQFPPDFAAFLDGLEARGLQWATNTTWTPESQIEVIRRSGLRSRPAGLIGAAGRTLAFLDGSGRLERDESHARAVAAEDEAFRARVWPAVRRCLGRLLDGDLASRLAFDYHAPLCIVDFTPAPGRSREAWAAVQPLLDSAEFAAFPPGAAADGDGGAPAPAALVPLRLSKGKGLRALQERLGVTPAETIAAGDGGNDLPMLDPAVARWMVCPGNAEPVVRRTVEAGGGVVAAREFAWGVMEGVERALAMAARGEGRGA